MSCRLLESGKLNATAYRILAPTRCGPADFEGSRKRPDLAWSNLRIPDWDTCRSRSTVHPEHLIPRFRIQGDGPFSCSATLFCPIPKREPTMPPG